MNVKKTIERKKTKQIRLGNVKIGCGAPVSIQSMIKVDTEKTAAVIKQAQKLQKAGCEVIRVAVKNKACVKSLLKIKDKISIPIEADIHFDYRLAILAIEAGVDCVRINPGNISKEDDVIKVINTAKKNKIPIRIGVNSGSLPDNIRLSKNRDIQAEQMVKAVLNYLKIFKKENFANVMISLKASDVYTTISAYRQMSKACDYPLHLGVTATGSGIEAIIRSALGIGTLLAEGIGDTIRVSLTGDPVNEVETAKTMLQSLGLRTFAPEVIACPTCGRCQVNLIKIVNDFKKKLYAKHYTLNNKNSYCIAIMGCEVNGPGEAKEADIGIAFGKDSGVIFKNGKIIKKVPVSKAVDELFALSRF